MMVDNAGNSFIQCSSLNPLFFVCQDPDFIDSGKSTMVPVLNTYVQEWISWMDQKVCFRFHPSPISIHLLNIL